MTRIRAVSRSPVVPDPGLRGRVADSIVFISMNRESRDRGTGVAVPAEQRATEVTQPSAPRIGSDGCRPVENRLPSRRLCELGPGAPRFSDVYDLIIRDATIVSSTTRLVADVAIQ